MWKVPDLPVMPWQMTRVFVSTRMLMSRSRSYVCLMERVSGMFHCGVILSTSHWPGALPLASFSRYADFAPPGFTTSRRKSVGIA